MVCRKCNGVNDDDALFCKYCGTKLNEENICHSCNQKNDDDATFCKYCGTKLNQEVPEVVAENHLEDQQKGLKLVKWIFGIIFFAVALLLMTLNFGSTFSNFVKINIPSSYADADLAQGVNMNANLFSVIENIQNYKEVTDNPIAIFYIMGESGLVSSIIQLVSILVAMIGTFVVLVVGASKAIYTFVTKKEFINIKKYVALSVCFLLCGALFVTIFGAKIKMSIDGISVQVIVKLGGFVATSIWLSVAFIFLCMIYDLVMNALEKNENTSISKSIFHILEVALLVCLVMTVAGFCIHIRTSSDYDYLATTNVMHNYFKAGSGFSYLNTAIYNMNKNEPYFFRFNTVSGVYIPSIICFILCMVLIVVFVIFLVKQICAKESKYSGSLAVGIISVCLSLAYMILVIILTKQLKSNNELMEYLFSNEDKKITIGASVIATFVLSILLLVEEIVGKAIIHKEK